MTEEYDRLAKRPAKNRRVIFRELFLAFEKQQLKDKFRELQTYGLWVVQKIRSVYTIGC